MSNSDSVKTPTLAKHLPFLAVLPPLAISAFVSSSELPKTSSVKHEIQPTLLDYMTSIHSMASILVLVAGWIVLDTGKPISDNDFVRDSSSDDTPPSGPQIPRLLLLIFPCILVIKYFHHEIADMPLDLIKHTKWRLCVPRKRRTAPQASSTTLPHSFSPTATSPIAPVSFPKNYVPPSRLYLSFGMLLCSALHISGPRLLNESVFDLASAESQLANTTEKGMGTLSKFRICYSKGIQTTPFLPVAGGTDMGDQPVSALHAFIPSSNFPESVENRLFLSTSVLLITLLQMRNPKLHKQPVKIVVGPTLLRFAITSTPRISSLHASRV